MYLLLRLMGWRPAVAHNPTFPYWLAGSMEQPYLVDRDGNRIPAPTGAQEER